MKHFLFAIFLATPLIATAEETSWIDAPQSRSIDDSQGKTQFSPNFGKRKGTFPAMYESVLDNRDSISGEFVESKFRYLYTTPIGDGGEWDPRHDESITSILLDCQQHMAGTLSIDYYLAGKLVAKIGDGENDVRFSYFPEESTAGDLCKYYETKTK